MYLSGTSINLSSGDVYGISNLTDALKQAEGIYLSIYVSMYLYIYLYICVSMYLCIYLSMYLCV
jgi:hypothetical protein